MLQKHKRIFQTILPLYTLTLIIILSLPISESSIGDILPKGRITITDFQAPNTVNAGESFTITATIKNDRFLPSRLKLTTDLLDGLLEITRKNIAKEQIITCSGRSSKQIEIDCTIREGDIDWYKEEYNIQATLYQKIPLIGYTPRDTSRAQGIHVKSKLGEKEKIRIINIDAPEQIAENTTTFPVTVTIANEGTFDQKTWIHIDLIEKPAVIPELEQFNLLKGLASERKELGRTTEKQTKAGSVQVFHIQCNLRETETDKKQFTIEAALNVNINGQHYQVDASTMQALYHEQPFLEQNYLIIIAGIFVLLLVLILIVIIIRIIYPSYYIKRIRLRNEKRRLDRRRRK